MENQSQVEFTAEDLDKLGEDLFGTEEEEIKDPTEDLIEEEEEPKKEEQEEEEDKPTKEEEPKEEDEEPKPQPKTTSDFTELAKDFIEEGEWEDVIIEGEGEEEDKKLSELIEEGKVDKQLFLSVKKEMDQAKKEQLDKEYIKINGGETKRKLIELINNGKIEEAKELLKDEPDTLQEPFEGFDNDNDKHNEHVVAWYYKTKGNTASETEVLVEKAKKDLTMDSIAAEVVEKAREQYKLNIENKNKEQVEKQQEEQKALKEYKKDLSSKFKELGVKDTTVKKFTDFATKENEDGQLPVDAMYEEIMQDPQKAVDFIYYMLEPEDFLKKKGEEVRRNLSVDTLRKIKRVAQDQKSKGSSKKTGDDEDGKKVKDWLDEVEIE